MASDAPVTMREAMVELSPALLWVVDTDGAIADCNSTWLLFRGRALEQERACLWTDVLHPMDRPGWDAAVSAHQPLTAAVRLLVADGRYAPVSLTARPWFTGDDTFGGYTCVGQIGPADSAPDSHLYKATIEALQEGVVVTDDQGLLVWVNEAAHTFLQLDGRDVLGNPLMAETAGLVVVDEQGLEVAPPDRPTAVARRTRRPVSDRTLGWRVGERGLRWFSVNSRTLLDDDGRVTEVVTSFLDVTEQIRAADNARHEARHDALTGLVNRWGLPEVVRDVLERTPRSGEDVALAYCDLDDFKTVNDSLGHAAGDELLRLVADRTVRCVRSSDVVARIGGDEIVIVLDGVHGLAGALAAAEKVRACIARPSRIRGFELTPHGSIGVALLSSMETLDETLNRADEAMYEAKAAGRNRVMTLDR